MTVTGWYGLVLKCSVACVLAVSASLAPGKPASSGPPAEILSRRADVGPESRIGWQALVTGTVRVTKGCLVIEEGSYISLVLWPHGTQWGSGHRAIRLPDGATLNVGDTISGAGGYVAAGRRDLQGIADADITERMIRCSRRTTKGVAVFNSYSYGPIDRV